MVHIMGVSRESVRLRNAVQTFFASFRIFLRYDSCFCVPGSSPGPEIYGYLKILEHEHFVVFTRQKSHCNSLALLLLTAPTKTSNPVNVAAYFFLLGSLWQRSQ